MLLKTLLFVLIAYFIVRASANLLRAMRRPEALGSPGPQPWGNGPSGRRREASGTQRGRPSEHRRATRDRLEPDVEDAKWEDV